MISTAAKEHKKLKMKSAFVFFAFSRG